MRTTTVTRLPEGICGTHRTLMGLGFRFRTPALASVVSRAFAAHAMRGAIKALDAPGIPFTYLATGNGPLGPEVPWT